MSEVKQLAQALEKMIPREWTHVRAAVELRRLQAENDLLVSANEKLGKLKAALQAENESLRADAERYQHIRASKWLSLGPVIGINTARDRKGVRYILSPVSIFSVPKDITSLDAAIDFARKA